MKIVPISRLKTNLSEYLLSIKNGDEILISDRGKAFAKIIPLDRDDAQLPSNLIELERAGFVRIGTGILPDNFFKIPRPKDKNGDTLKSLLKEREDGR
jgi:prevent-host-death family protein